MQPSCRCGQPLKGHARDAPLAFLSLRTAAPVKASRAPQLRMAQVMQSPSLEDEIAVRSNHIEYHLEYRESRPQAITVLNTLSGHIEYR
jgi:hypothetical protein